LLTAIVVSFERASRHPSPPRRRGGLSSCRLSPPRRCEGLSFSSLCLVPIRLFTPVSSHPSLHTLLFTSVSSHPSHPSVRTRLLTPVSSHPSLHTRLFTSVSSHPSLHPRCLSTASLHTRRFTPVSSHPPPSTLPPTLTSARPPTRVWEVVSTVAAPPSIVVKCGGGGSLCGRVWCFSCRVLCCVVVVLFLSCRVLWCSCCVFVCVTCFSYHTPQTRRHGRARASPVHSRIFTPVSSHPSLHTCLFTPVLDSSTLPSTSFLSLRPAWRCVTWQRMLSYRRGLSPVEAGAHSR